MPNALVAIGTDIMECMVRIQSAIDMEEGAQSIEQRVLDVEEREDNHVT